MEMGPASSASLFLESRVQVFDLPTLPEPSRERQREIVAKYMRAVWSSSDRVIAYVILGHWTLVALLALTFSPFLWRGGPEVIYRRLLTAVIVGGLLSALPLFLLFKRPGWWVTRHAAAAALMLWSALLIHLSGGRIEAHFHVFGLLALLAIYRDWRVILTATVVCAADHLIRGTLWPESVYGVSNPEWWRFLEHGFWVAFEAAVLMLGCRRGLELVRVVARKETMLEVMNVHVERQLMERTAQLSAGREQFRALLGTANAVPWEMDPDTGRFIYVGSQAVGAFGYPRRDWLKEGFFEGRIADEDRQRVHSAITNALVRKTSCEIECRLINAEGAPRDVRDVVNVVVSPDGELRVWGLIFDITEKRRSVMELLQAQKLEAVGRLAAGVAHEINTPIQYINDSVHFVKGGISDLQQLLIRYRELGAEASAGGLAPEGYRAAVDEADEAADLGYLKSHMPAAADSCIAGLERVTEIVRSMKAFAYPDRKEMSAVDLNEVLRHSLIIARGEYKYVADVDAAYGDLPLVSCFGGELGQVFLNIVVNAAHAIGDVVAGTEQRGKITVRTRSDGAEVVVSIGDTGGGIPEACRAKIFEQFFTTKQVGKGTGQGLAIARSAVARHGGSLTFDTEVGRGTTFHIRVPVAGPVQEPPPEV